jgi:quercetin dioxygenase-like cupin family protein
VFLQILSTYIKDQISIDNLSILIENMRREGYEFAVSKAEVLTLRDQVAYQSGQVVSRTLAQNEHVSVTLFSFDKGEEISTHESGGDAMVTCLDGVGRITIDGVEHILHEGESIVMPARHPHAVYGQEQFKMLLVVVF